MPTLIFNLTRKRRRKSAASAPQLEGWKQAYRLDKKLLFKFERIAAAAPAEVGEKPDNSKGKSKDNPEAPPAAPSETVKLLVRLDFPITKNSPSNAGCKESVRGTISGRFAYPSSNPPTRLLPIPKSTLTTWYSTAVCGETTLLSYRFRALIRYT